MLGRSACCSARCRVHIGRDAHRVRVERHNVSTPHILNRVCAARRARHPPARAPARPTRRTRGHRPPTPSTPAPALLRSTQLRAAPSQPCATTPCRRTRRRCARSPRPRSGIAPPGRLPGSSNRTGFGADAKTRGGSVDDDAGARGALLLRLSSLPKPCIHLSPAGAPAFPAACPHLPTALRGPARLRLQAPTRSSVRKAGLTQILVSANRGCKKFVMLASFALRFLSRARITRARERAESRAHGAVDANRNTGRDRSCVRARHQRGRPRRRSGNVSPTPGTSGSASGTALR